jgi:hypothetical protein
MASNAYPIDAPVVFQGTGAVFVSNTGAIVFNRQTVYDFVTSATGATLYVGASGALAALPIGTPGQQLKVNAGATAPEWVTPASDGPIFSAFSTGAGTAIAGSSTWTTLSDTYVGWDMTSGVTGADFDVSTGEFTVAATGVYEFACSVSFQGNNSATPGLLTTTPAGLASRQLALKVNGVEVTYATRQAEPSISNQTHVAIYNAKLALIPSDAVSVAVRHDASSSLTVGSDSRTSFSGSRVR